MKDRASTERLPPSFGDRLGRGLRQLDRRLGIDHSGRSEWVWAVPAAIFVATAIMFIAYIQIGSGSAALTLAAGVPLGMLSGAVLAGLSVGFMTPAELEDDSGGDGGRPADPGLPPGGRDLPSLSARPGLPEVAARETVGAGERG